MQEAAEGAAGKKGVPKGPQGTKGIVVLSNDMSWSSPKEKKNNKKGEDDDEDEGSETPSIAPRNLSYSSTSARAPKSPAKRRYAAWPPKGEEEEEEEEGEIRDDEDDDDHGGSGSRHSYEGIEIAIDHANLYDWLLKWTKEYGIPGTTPLGVFNTLCLDGTMDEWLTGIDEVNVPTAWADDGWAAISLGELMCVFTYLTILLTLGDLAVETGILAPRQSEMFWSYRQTLIYYPADSSAHKIVVDLSRMVRVCITSLTPKKREIEGGGQSSRMAYGKEESLIAINSNAGNKQVAARLRSYRDCKGDNGTQLTEQSLLTAIKNRKVDKSEAKHMAHGQP